MRAGTGAAGVYFSETQIHSFLYVGQSVIQGGCVAFKNVIDISQFIKILTWIFSNEINEQFKLILPSFSMSVVIFMIKWSLKCRAYIWTQRDRRAYLVGIENGRIGSEKDGRSGAGRRG